MYIDEVIQSTGYGNIRVSDYLNMLIFSFSIFFVKR